MTECLDRFAPDASEVVRLAARCQHLCRWEIPRDAFPLGRKGYHQWRTTLAKRHADLAAEILADVGYDPQVIDRVADLLMKKRLRMDAEVQLLEDVVCLVFLEHYFEGFSAKHADDKVIDIVKKTWIKMSQRARAEALGLTLSPIARSLVERALQ